jgi:hypothetical protein
MIDYSPEYQKVSLQVENSAAYTALYRFFFKFGRLLAINMLMSSPK